MSWSFPEVEPSKCNTPNQKWGPVQGCGGHSSLKLLKTGKSHGTEIQLCLWGRNRENIGELWFCTWLHTEHRRQGRLSCSLCIRTLTPKGNRQAHSSSMQDKCSQSCHRGPNKFFLSQELLPTDTAQMETMKIAPTKQISRPAVPVRTGADRLEGTQEMDTWRIAPRILVWAVGSSWSSSECASPELMCLTSEQHELPSASLILTSSCFSSATFTLPSQSICCQRLRQE